MKTMLRPVSGEKKALSNMVAYVLLISITLSLSVMVYNWLMHYVPNDDRPEVPECPEGVNVIIYNYTCNAEVDFEFTLKNKGRFSIDGFIVRVHNRSNPEFGIYTINLTGVPLAPGESNTMKYGLDPAAPNLAVHDQSISPPKLLDLGNITMIDVQPFKNGDDGQVSCQSRAVQLVRECEVV